MDALQQLNIAAPVADIFGKLEYDIIVAIARQLSKNPDKLINHTSEWRIQMLARMGKVSKETARYIAQQTKDVPGDVEAIINEVVTAVLDEHGLAGNDKVIENLSKALEMFDHQAIEDKYNQVNTVMQYKARKAYVDGVNGVADRFEKGQIANKQEHLDILNKNALEVTLGEKTRTEAVRDTIREMADRGIPAFVDASGREWSPEAYVSMDIRNTAKNAALMSEFEATKELGQDVILVSSHAAARPLCAPYQGKFYSLSGKAGTITDAYGKEYTYTPLSSTSYGEPAGLFGINCGHTFRGVEDGLFVNNEETYSEKENSEEYEKVQKQRRMEREIRKNKMKRDALRAAGDEEGAREYDLKVRQGNKRLNEYCAENGLTVRQDRTQVYGYKDESRKEKPIEFVQTVEPKKPAFVPAGSIEEAQTKAEAHFKEYFGDKTFKGKADFKGISLDNANDICERLDKLYSEYDIPPLAGIKAIDPNSAKGKKIFADADAVMAYSPIEHGVFLNKNVLKNSDTLAKYNRESDKAWNTVMNNIDTLSGSKKAMALRYKQAGRALVGDGSVGDYLQHEVGHHVQWEVLDAKTNNLIGSRMSDYATKISGYATASKGEYIAESFSAYVKGQRNILDPEFVSFMDQKRLDNFGKSDIIKENKLLYPDTLAGVKRGKPMTHIKADSGNVNPHYGEKGFDKNCQSCTIVYEARRRGFDVETSPCLQGSMAERLANQYTLAWIDPKTGKRPGYIKDNSMDSPSKYLDYMKRTINPNERYVIGFSWKGKGNGGHIVNLDLDDNGEIRITDNQRGEHERREYLGDKAVLKYLKQMKWSETISGYKMPKVPKMLRIDNLQFEPDVAKKIMKERE